ncbi:MAG TPA: glycoside hydrolase family 2 TIM barrel-domain containing protein [Saprospiraceae bacterium]|nr:glycoside hydrolase family 2 TIM barrel-domain containing protein [Saprospiraceae bacterium]HPI04830.1 glycoside hydrolase family 2 TIM barrel-domain containing protein [Saprospiraceae bacterium]
MQKTILFFTFLLALTPLFSQTPIPLPEHPRPDFQRADWQNLNGDWAFEFDQKDAGIRQKWFAGTKKFTRTIHVPFPWGSPLSGVPDSADIAWYKRKITVPAAWKGKRTFVTIGASDWRTTVYLDGKEIGSHEGGYTPFSFDLTPYIRYGVVQNLVVRADDVRRQFALYGKQGYGNARGIWQTVYLESRGNTYLEALHFTPDIDAGKVKMTAFLPAPAAENTPFKLTITGNGQTSIDTKTIPKGQSEYTFDVSMPNARLWSLDDPFLYEVDAVLGDDAVHSYFGMRKISVVNLPGTSYPYVALNNQPIYLELTLDQSYHPEGFYTFPSDEFMKEEILRTRQIGLNGIRTHIKVDIPRKLYWADRLGVLVMSDLPNFWGEPDAAARKESETTFREMLKRDFNHPAIFSWILFNETWGLTHKVMKGGKEEWEYRPETQKWVAEMYRKAKIADPTRIIEDNSICCGRGHTETDLNSWHDYLPGWMWEERLAEIDKETYAGSTHHFEKGYVQGNQPNINSECGNVWGYDGSTGDVDWSWDYHRMMNTFRKYPKVAGWLYTEHHDVINEWNGYWRFDRTNKETGLGDLTPGMSLRDFHSDFYISTGNEISRSVQPGQKVSVPLYASFNSPRTDLGSQLNLRVQMHGFDAIGQEKVWLDTMVQVPYKPWMQQALQPLALVMPNEKSVATLSLTLLDNAGAALHHNCAHFIVEAPVPAEITLANGKKALLVSREPKQTSGSQWSQKLWTVLDGLKVNGAGSGYFEYRFVLPKGTTALQFESASFIAEVSAKTLFVKDMEKGMDTNIDYMLGKGTVAPSQNPNAYPMTDATPYPGEVSVSANGFFAGRFELPDDPADHRGVLSWHYQPKERKLHEAGSYGYRISASIPKAALEQAQKTGELIIRLEVPESMGSGLAVYGDHFGRYPINPSVLLIRY